MAVCKHGTKCAYHCLCRVEYERELYDKLGKETEDDSDSSASNIVLGDS